MAFKLNKTSENLFHKISESKSKSPASDPMLNVGVGKTSASALKNRELNEGGTGVKGENGLGTIGSGQKNIDSMRAIAPDLSMTPYSVKNGKGTIHGPKVSYDMAYNKAKKTKQYANMSKSDYIKEAKRQTKSFQETGNWDASGASKPKPKKATINKGQKQKPITNSTLVSKPIVKIEVKKPEAEIVKRTPKKANTSKKTTRLSKTVDKIATAKASGNDKKAARLEKRAGRIKGRADRKALKQEIKDSRKKQKKSGNTIVPDYSGKQ